VKASSTLSRANCRRIAAGLCLASLLAGCSSDGGGDWRDLVTLAAGAWSANGNVSLQEASGIPFATLGLRIGSDPEHILVLATDSNGERLWTSSAHVSLTTHHGRIVGTSGLSFNLSGYMSEGAPAGGWKTRATVRWIADYPDIHQYNVEIACVDEPAATEVVSILDYDMRVLRVEETCRAEQLAWSFENTYWVNPDTNRVWRSVQHVHPNIDALTTELLRPPDSPG